MCLFSIYEQLLEGCFTQPAMKSLAAPTMLAFKQLASAEHMRLYRGMAAAEAAGGDSWGAWQARWHAAVRICGWGCVPEQLRLEQWGGQRVFLQLLPVARALLRCLASRGFGSGCLGSAGFAAQVACEGLARMALLSIKDWHHSGESPPQLLAAHLEAAALCAAGVHAALGAWEAEGCSGSSPEMAAADLFALIPLVKMAFGDCPRHICELAADTALAAAEAAIRLAAALLQLGQRRQRLFVAGESVGKATMLLQSFAFALLYRAKGCTPTQARKGAAACAAGSAAKLCLVVGALPASHQVLLSDGFGHKLKGNLALLLTCATHTAVTYVAPAAGGGEHGPAAAGAGSERGLAAAGAVEAVTG